MNSNPETLLIHRLRRWASDFRKQKGTLPTLSDLEKGGFPKDLVAKAVKQGKLEELYVTMTSGAIAKGYKAKVD